MIGLNRVRWGYSHPAASRQALDTAEHQAVRVEGIIRLQRLVALALRRLAEDCVASSLVLRCDRIVWRAVRLKERLTDARQPGGKTAAPNGTAVHQAVLPSLRVRDLGVLRLHLRLSLVLMGVDNLLDVCGLLLRRRRGSILLLLLRRRRSILLDLLLRRRRVAVDGLLLLVLLCVVLLLVVGRLLVGHLELEVLRKVMDT